MGPYACKSTKPTPSKPGNITASTEIGEDHRWPGVDDAELIVSELATNAVRHSESGRFGGCFTVAIQVDRDKVWLGVLDQDGPRIPRPLPPPLDGEGGRGLALVAGLAMSWGVTGDSQGRIVWASMDLASRQASPR